MPLSELVGPKDMLAKAHREHARLKQRIDIDNVFNFLVTAHHIRDYIKHSGLVSQQVLDTFAQDQDVAACRDLANTGKHLRLTKQNRATPHNRVVQSYIGAGKVGEMMVGARDTWVLSSGAQTVEVLDFADRLLQKWEAFFQANGV